jgi:subtilisin family serine protease
VKRSCGVLALLLLVTSHVQAQLPVGGFLGPRIEDTIEGRLEAEIERVAEATVELATEQNIQENIEDTIEETIEQQVDASVEDSIDEVIAQAVDEQVESGIEADVTDSVEASIEAAVEDGIQVAVEDAAEAAAEAAVTEAVDSAVEESVGETVEEAVAQAVENSVEQGVEEDITATVEDSIEASVEEAVAGAMEESVAAAVEESVASAVEESVAADIEGSVEASVEAGVEADIEQRVMIAVEERLELEIVDAIESELEDDESRILKEQWLVMAEPTVFAELQVKGYLFDTVTELPALGLRLAEVAAPSTFDITDVRNGVLDVVGKDRAEVDLNHFYTAGAPVSSSVAGVDPRAAMLLPTDLDDLDVRVGMIDSRVDMSHPALAASRIETRSFARPGAEAPDFHGTAIASIIAANSAEFRGLAPNAELFAASVFELDRKRGEVASTVSLIRALDWLLSTKVDVINISLAGPPNRLLEKALQRAADNRVVVMAAAGNGGPVARPMYPAAYDSVVAVTAVDATQQVFRLANRGDYLALAAPGVDLRHARAGGGYAASSGTSFAVPFAVTAAARLSRLRPQDDIITMLLESALDLGPPGRDTIYGYGLLTLSSL